MDFTTLTPLFEEDSGSNVIPVLGGMTREQFQESLNNSYPWDDHLIDGIAGKQNGQGNPYGLRLEWDVKSEGVVAFDSQGFIIPHGQMEPLITALRRFYDNYPAQVIGDHNRQVREVMDREATESRHVSPVKPGWIYLIRSESGDYKIGKSRKGTRRAYSFSIQLPFPTEVIHQFPAADYSRAEKMLHEMFAARRTNGEWFRLNEGDVAYIKAIDSISAEGRLNE